MRASRRLVVCAEATAPKPLRRNHITWLAGRMRQIVIALRQ